MDQTIVNRPNGVPVLHTVRRTRLSSGEDVPLVLDREGLVAFWPATYLGLLRGKAVSTLDFRARTVASLEDFLSYRDINLEARMREGSFLTPAEAAAIRDHLRLVGPRTAERKKSGSGELPQVGLVEWRNRLLCTVDYLDGVITQLIEMRRSSAELHLSMERRRDAMLYRLLPNFAANNSVPTRGLTKEMQKVFREAIRPTGKTNPFPTERERIANYPYLATLDAIGSRRSEPQLVKLCDLVWLHGRPAARLNPNSDDPDDTRRQRPSLKRAPRPLVLNDGLAHLLFQYRDVYRARVGEALERRGDLERLAAFRRNPYLFVSETGAPLSTSSVNAMFAALKTVPGLPKNFSPRMLRNTWNDRQVEKEHAAAKDERAYAQLQDLRRQRMGWSQNSKMLERYALNALESLANDATHDASLQFESLVR